MFFITYGFWSLFITSLNIFSFLKTTYINRIYYALNIVSIIIPVFFF